MELRVREARRHAGDVHAGAVELAGQRLAEHGEPRLRRRVGAPGDPRRHAADVDDRPLAAVDHAGHGGVRQPHRSGDEHVEQALLVVDVAVGEAGVEPEAGVVDKHPDRGRRVGEPGGDPVDAVAGGEVGGQHLDADAVGVGQAGRQGAQPGLVARDEHEAVALPRELLGEAEADAGGGSGDEGGGHGIGSSGWAPGRASGGWCGRSGEGWSTPMCARVPFIAPGG